MTEDEKRNALKFAVEIKYLKFQEGIYQNASKKLEGVLSAPICKEWAHLPDVQLLHTLPENVLYCPLHQELLTDTHRWTDFSNKAYKPRLIYDMKKNIWLVSRLYKCCRCKSPYQANDFCLMRQCKSAPTFILFKKSGVSLSYYTYIANSVETGKMFKDCHLT
jgi:hypothetical protein